MIDEVTLHLKAGNGGDGKVSFRREKFVPRGGPDGGDGGNGGSIYIKSDTNLKTLDHYSGKKGIEAKDGQSGGQSKKHGFNSPDIILYVPVGTQIKDADTNEVIVDLNSPEMNYRIACGGRGGRGNWHFRSSINTTPRTAEEGTRGEEKNIILNLKVIANVGLIGFPNAGKSTILSVLTKAKPKIADYPFTTLSPNLGVMENSDRKSVMVIADIPGLIGGASKGKGLGTRFLKHIERCKLLVYVLSPEFTDLENDGDDIAKALLFQLNTIKAELNTFNKRLTELPSIIILNKIDLLSKEKRDQILNIFINNDIDIIMLSAATRENIDSLRSALINKVVS